MVGLIAAVAMCGCASEPRTATLANTAYDPAPVPVRGKEYKVGPSPLGEVVRDLGPLALAGLSAGTKINFQPKPQ